MIVGDSKARRASKPILGAFAIVFVPAICLASAECPRVSFDFGYMVECYDVTPQAFALLHPDEKIIEADVRVSVRTENGNEKDIEQLQFEISSPGERLRIIDFMPRTQIETEAANPIEVVKTSESIRSVGAGVGTALSASAGNSHVSGAITSTLPAGSANAIHRNELKETTKKIPPGKVVVASGTLANEHGVYFKLRRSSVHSLEGIKPLSFRFVVPSQWRGDWVVISCQATGTVKHRLFKTTDEIGATKAFLALELSGDATAGQAARELADAQEKFFAFETSKERDEMFNTMTAEASPWHSSADINTALVSRLFARSSMPGNSNGIHPFATFEKPVTSAAAKWLKQSVDGVARFSAFQAGVCDER